MISKALTRVIFASLLAVVTCLPSGTRYTSWAAPPIPPIALHHKATVTTTWARTYGNLTHRFSADRLVKIQDGGYAIAGSTYLSGTFQGGSWLAKLDAEGQIVWQQLFTNPPNVTAVTLQTTSDGGYIVVGGISGPGIGDVWVAKLSNSGSVISQRQYDISGRWDYATDVVVLSDGLLIVGATNVGYDDPYGKALVLRIDNAGNVVWQRAYGNLTQRTEPWRVIALDNSGYVIAGTSGARGTTSGSQPPLMWFARIDMAGALLWEKRYKTNTATAEAYDILATPDGGFLAVGNLNLASTSLLKLDANGNPIWQRQLDASGGRNVAGRIAQLNDGNYFVLGAKIVTESSPPFRVNTTGWMVKTNGQGDILWQRRYALTETLGLISSFSDFVLTDQGGFVAVGATNAIGNGDLEMLLMKTDADGNVGNACPWVMPYNLVSTVVTNTQTPPFLPTEVTSGTISISATTAVLSPTLATVNTLCTNAPALDKYAFLPIALRQ